MSLLHISGTTPVTEDLPIGKGLYVNGTTHTHTRIANLHLCGIRNHDQISRDFALDCTASLIGFLLFEERTEFSLTFDLLMHISYLKAFEMEVYILQTSVPVLLEIRQIGI